MNIRLLALDMDGTVLRSDGTVSGRTRDVLKKAAARGALVVPATGRVVKMLPEPVRSIPGVRYAVTANGGSLWDLKDSSALYTNPMPTRDADFIIRLFASYGLMVEAYCGGVSYSDRKEFRLLRRFPLPDRILRFILRSQQFVEDLPGYLAARGLSVEKINVPFLPPALRPEILKRLKGMRQYTVTSSGFVNLEINAASCSKGEALRHLCRKLGVAPAQVMAFGDADNDVTMLRFAGFGVAMANAEPAARQAADFVTASNDEDGVAAAVERFVFSGG